ncbi:MAG: hypothetical protein ACJ715_04030 [Ornithinibacter sp.]
MTRPARVRSEALVATAARLEALADEVRDDAHALAVVAAHAGPGPVRGPGELAVLAQWVRLEGEAAGVVGPAGAWGEGLALEVLALHLRAAARVYAQVEASVAALMAGVAVGADLAARGGWLGDGSTVPRVRVVEATLKLDAGSGFRGAADLVAAAEGLDGGRVRVVEVSRGGGGSAWVVIVPGTQEWSPHPGANPFDVTTDVRAVTGDATLAAAGVAAALEVARARAGGRSRAGDPVVLVGHSQGGILAVALASDPAFAGHNRVTHVVTTGSPVALFPVPPAIAVLSVERGDDPVPRLDLSPNPDRPSWVTLRTPSTGPVVDVGAHRLEGYVATLRVAEAAPRGTIEGLDAWQASAGGVLGRPVRSVSEVAIERAQVPEQHPRRHET